MTVSSQTSRAAYSGNGSTTTFTVPYYFISSSDLTVIKRSASGIDTTLVLNTNYTVSGAGVSTGGSITTTVAPALGETLTIIRIVPLTQLVDYQPNDPFPANTHELALDKLTMEIQQIQDQLNRAVIFPAADSNSLSSTLPNSASRAGKYMTFDANGQPSTTTQDVTQLANAAAASATAAAGSATTAAGYASASATSATNANTSASSAAASLSAITPIANSLAPTITTYSGDSSTVAFSLPYSVTTKALIDVYIGGVYQQASQYAVSGTTLTFTAAPPTGTNNIEVKTAANVTYVVPQSSDYGLITSSATSTADYGAVP